MAKWYLNPWQEYHGVMLRCNWTDGQIAQIAQLNEDEQKSAKRQNYLKVWLNTLQYDLAETEMNWADFETIEVHI